MRELAILTFVTLDGVMQAPSLPEEDFSGDFKHGGWARPYWGEVMAQVKEEAMAVPYDLLLGRRTYEIFAASFSNSDDDSDPSDITKATKYVATNTLEKLDWKNSVPIAGNIADEVVQLKAQEGPLLQVHGSWQLIQTLLKSDLVDEFRLWVFPVIAGSGKRLFGDIFPKQGLTLVKSRTTENGVVMTIYRRDNSSKA